MKRTVQQNQDQGSIESTIFNMQVGAQKNMDMGWNLLALDDGAGGKTTNAATARALPGLGRSIAVYNNSSSIGAVTLGTDATVTAELAGVVNGTSKNVGIPCTPNDWTVIACCEKQWVKATASTLLVFLIADDSKIAV